MIQESMGLKYKPASEPLHISVNLEPSNLNELINLLSPRCTGPCSQFWARSTRRARAQTIRGTRSTPRNPRSFLVSYKLLVPHWSLVYPAYQSNLACSVSAGHGLHGVHGHRRSGERGLPRETLNPVSQPCVLHPNARNPQRENSLWTTYRSEFTPSSKL